MEITIQRFLGLPWFFMETLETSTSSIYVHRIFHEDFPPSSNPWVFSMKIFPKAPHFPYIWANYNNSLTWIKAMNGDDFPNPNYDFQGSLVVSSL